MFVLGVGAQKSGTTWLYNQLSKDPSFVSLDRKELHYWDQEYGLHQPGSKSLSDVRRWFSAEQPLDSAQPTPIPGFLATDYDYFWKLQQALNSRGKDRAKETLVSDITPAYSGLPLYVWRKIARELHERKIEFRVVFSMRDPVSRIKSALHHDLRRGKIRIGTNLDAIAIAMAGSWAYQYRTRYELTLSNLEAAFPKENIQIMFMEMIQTDENQHLELQRSLGRNLGYFDRARARNEARYEPFELETQMAIARLFQPTYVDLENRYPFLSEVWPGLSLLGK